MQPKIAAIVFSIMLNIIVPLTPLFATELTPPVPADQLNNLLKNIENNFSKIKTLKTMLTQEKSIALFSKIIISKGFCLFKSPDRLRLEFIEPFKSSIVINDDQILKYEFFNEKWQKLDTGQTELSLLIMENITSWLKGEFNNPALYEIYAFNGNNLTLTLTPKAEEFKRFISMFELGLNHEMNGLEYIIIHESKDNYTKIYFHNDVVNKDIPDFIFENNADKPHPVSQW
jgi:outer membrane lipoprotein-sorting protein